MRASLLWQLDFDYILLASLVLGFFGGARAAFGDQDLVLESLIVEVCEVSASACVEQNVSCTRYDLVFICARAHLVVVELEPLFAI